MMYCRISANGGAGYKEEYLHWTGPFGLLENTRIQLRDADSQ